METKLKQRQSQKLEGGTKLPNISCLFGNTRFVLLHCLNIDFVPNSIITLLQNLAANGKTFATLVKKRDCLLKMASSNGKHGILKKSSLRYSTGIPN